MKKNIESVKGYVRSLPDATLYQLHDRLTQRFADDLAESIKMIQNSPEIDKWLSSAKDSKEFFDLIDLLQDQVVAEARKRNAISAS